MCILFIYHNPSPSTNSYRLILIANRDEYYARPAKPAHYWKDYPECLGGTDMEPGREGGTWLALAPKKGRIGVLLNLNGTPKSTEGRGRGFLIRDYLTTQENTMSHANNLHETNQNTQCYNPYNLVMIDLRRSDVCYVSSEKGHRGPQILQDKILGFGNSGIETPYKKVLAGKEKFEKLVTNATNSQQNQLIEMLLQFLKQEERYLPDDELKKRSPEAFNELSSIFVRHEMAKYGTRTHSIVLVNHNYQLTFVEETLNSDGTWQRQIFNNQLN
ncbi:transport and Golgi organization protein 2 [Phymastichus coffea]|uniref:transport and Golgi organization protein 2 n=1 Tax=Phymastichus coffea TaxID=108790 RepID=UPI00273BA4A4|nr:transport and Golgi organization protein 2 [Phymastichus coffea]